MDEKRKSVFDRRSGNDRHKVYKLGYFANGGIERRRYIIDRRNNLERRKDWTYIEGCCIIQSETLRNLDYHG